MKSLENLVSYLESDGVVKVGDTHFYWDNGNICSYTKRGNKVVADYTPLTFKEFTRMYRGIPDDMWNIINFTLRLKGLI